MAAATAARQLKKRNKESPLLQQSQQSQSTVNSPSQQSQQRQQLSHRQQQLRQQQQQQQGQRKLMTNTTSPTQEQEQGTSTPHEDVEQNSTPSYAEILARNSTITRDMTNTQSALRLANARKSRPTPAPKGDRAEYPVIIKPDTHGPINFTKAGSWQQARMLEEAVGRVVSIRQIGSGDWLVDCTNQQQRQKLFQLTQLKHQGRALRITTSLPKTLVVGVVKGVPKQDNMEELLRQDLKEQGLEVESIKRLNMTGQRPSGAVRVAFLHNQLPTTVLLGRTRHRVEPFIPNVRPCSKCQLLGHSTKACRSRQTHCSQCSLTHPTDSCHSKVLCCANCGGQHASTDRRCPEIGIRRLAHQLKNTTFMPFLKALETTRSQWPACNNNSQPAPSAVVKPSPQIDRDSSREEEPRSLAIPTKRPPSNTTPSKTTHTEQRTSHHPPHKDDGQQGTISSTALKEDTEGVGTAPIDSERILSTQDSEASMKDQTAVSTPNTIQDMTIRCVQPQASSTTMLRVSQAAPDTQPAATQSPMAQIWSALFKLRDITESGLSASAPQYIIEVLVQVLQILEKILHNGEQ